jgi:addiction module HigA family antidote
MKEIGNIHPGEILLEDFLKPLELSQNQLARDIQVPPRRINEIILGKRSVTSDTSIRLGQYFGMSHRFFLNLQLDYDMEAKEKELEKILKTIPTRKFHKVSFA